MGINLSNFLSPQNKNSKMGDLQDLDHIDGVAISTISAELYSNSRDDLVMYYFRDGANYASVYTKSKIVSENIKWNLKQKSNRIFSLLVNTRNANAFTGAKGYQALQKIAEILSTKLTEKQKEDDNNPEKIKAKQILFDKFNKTLFNASSNSFNFSSLIFVIFECLAFPVEKIVTISFVLVSLSQVMALKVV